MFADIDYYKNIYGGSLNDETAVKAIQNASNTIDALTFGRAAGNTLTEKQNDIIKRVCCEIADWETENADLLNCPMSSYSLNGTSMTFGGSSPTVIAVSGVVVPRRIYSELSRTGLCCRSLGV